MHAYLTVTKTVFNLEDNAHDEHQNIPQTSTEYSQGTSGENIKTTGKKEVIHSSTNATNKQTVGQKDLHLVSYQVFLLATIPQDLWEVAEVANQRGKV